MHTPEYLGPTPAEPSNGDSNGSAPESPLPPIVCPYGGWIYDATNTPEGTARNVLETRYFVDKIEDIQVNKELTELNLLLPVDQNRLDAYRYSSDFLKEHFQVITATVISTEGKKFQYNMKMVEDPASGIWELWYSYSYAIDE